MERLCIGAAQSRPISVSRATPHMKGLDELVNDLAEQNRHEEYRHRSEPQKSVYPRGDQPAGKSGQRGKHLSGIHSAGQNSPRRRTGHFSIDAVHRVWWKGSDEGTERLTEAIRLLQLHDDLAL